MEEPFFPDSFHNLGSQEIFDVLGTDRFGAV